MRYVTATIGTLVVFFSVVVIGFVVFAFLPPQFGGQDFTFRLGMFHARGNPVLLLTPPLAMAGISTRFAIR